MTGTLYVVATPIGNLEDLTQRAIRVLREVDCVACEDTRLTGRLLDHLGVRKPLLSYYYPREREKMQAILGRLQVGQSVALVTDSGTPAFSDPGAALVAAAHDRGIRVEPVPGPCAAAAAFSVAGMESTGFHFAGFLPDALSARNPLLHRLARSADPVILYVAPHDLRRYLDEILSFFGDRDVLLARELTKKFEQVHRGRLTQLASVLPETPRGEIVLVIAPGPVPEIDPTHETTLAERFGELLVQGYTRAQAIKKLSQERSMTKRDVAETLRGE